ncbi:MAG: hypothetical protein VCA36_00545 [Opitutales bacterium]
MALYNESTGERYAKVHYEKFSKRPSRIGFLKIGLPILTFHELSLTLDASQANAKSLLSTIEKAANSHSARYLFGENVTVMITDGKRNPIRLRASKAKFHKEGLRLFGGVELSLPGEKLPFRCESLYLKAEQETNSLLVITSRGVELDKIQLGQKSQALVGAGPAAKENSSQIRQ